MWWVSVRMRCDSLLLWNLRFIWRWEKKKTEQKNNNKKLSLNRECLLPSDRWGAQGVAGRKWVESCNSYFCKTAHMLSRHLYIAWQDPCLTGVGSKQEVVLLFCHSTFLDYRLPASVVVAVPRRWCHRGHAHLPIAWSRPHVGKRFDFF